MEMAEQPNDRQPKEAIHLVGNTSSDSYFLHLIGAFNTHHG